MYSIGRNGNKTAYGIMHFYADTPDDISKISTVGLTPGSTVFVISLSLTYMLNNQKQWVKVNLNNTSDNGNTPDTYVYEGGTVI